MSHPQLGFISGRVNGSYLVSLPLLTLEVTIPDDRVFVMIQTVTVEHVPPADPVVTATMVVPVLETGQEVIVVFADGNLNVPVIIAARPLEG